MDFNDLNFEDIISDAEKKKKTKKKARSKDKGNRGERLFAKLLKERFGFDFTRTLGSGNRWSQVQFLPNHAQQTFSGDLVCPETFKFVIECKDGYNDEDLHSVLSKNKGLAEINGWIKQSLNESKRCDRLPMIAWKKDYKPWIVFIQEMALQDFSGKGDFYGRSRAFEYSFKYREWIIVPLTELLKLPDEFFFKG